MKTCSLYGFMSAIAGAILLLALYFLGFHTDPAKFTAAKWIGGLGGLAIWIVLLTLGVKARRAEVPADKPFGYGQAFGAAFMIGLVNSVVYSVFYYIYMAFINTGFTELMVQDTMDKMQAKGMSGAQLDNMEKGVRFMSGAGVQSITALIGGLVFGAILSLIIAACLKRAAPPAGIRRSRKEKGPGFLRALELGLAGRSAADQPSPVNAVVQRQDGAEARDAEESCGEVVHADRTERKQNCGYGEDRRGDPLRMMLFSYDVFLVTPRPEVGGAAIIHP